MVMTESVKPSLSMPGIALVLMMATAGWLVSPARSCPPKADAGSERADAAPSPCHRDAATPEKKEGLTTFERYIKDKKEGGVHNETNAPLAKRLAAIAPALGRLAPVGRALLVGDMDRRERIEELQEQLEELGEKLERISEALDHGPGGPGHGYARAPRAPRPPRAPRAPRAPRPPRAPRAPEPPHFSLGWHPGAESVLPEPGQMWSDVNDAKMVWKTYRLPEGKLEDFTELMSRSDVPILVRSKPQAIEIQATQWQHEVFLRFLQLIDPSKERAGSGPAFRWGAAFAAGPGCENGCQGDCPRCCSRPCGAKPCERCGRAAKYRADADRLTRKAAEKLTRVRARTRGKIEEVRARARDEVRQARERLRRHARSARDEVMVHEETAEALEREAEALAEQAESLREQSQRIIERAEEIRQRASERSEGGSPDEAFERHAEALQLSAEAMREQAEQLADQQRQLEEQRRTIEEEARALEGHAERLNERAEAIEQAAGSLDCDAEATPELARSIIELATRIEQTAAPIAASALRTAVSALTDAKSTDVIEAVGQSMNAAQPIPTIAAGVSKTAPGARSPADGTPAEKTVENGEK